MSDFRAVQRDLGAGGRRMPPEGEIALCGAFPGGFSGKGGE